MKRLIGIKINPGGNDDVTFTDKPPAFVGVDMAKEGADQTVLTVSREMLVDAFNAWLKKYNAYSDEFVKPEGDDYGDRCADWLIGYLTAEYESIGCRIIDEFRKEAGGEG